MSKKQGILKILVTVLLCLTLLFGTTLTAFADESETIITTGDGTEGNIVVDNIVDNGEPASAPVEGTSDTASTETSGTTKEENPEEYDQTTVSKTDRTATVEVKDVTVTSGDPVYDTETGSPLDPETADGYNYYWNDIWDVDNNSYTEKGVTWTTGYARPYTYDKSDPDTLTKQKREGACQRVVGYDNGTPDDYSDDVSIGGFYCIDLTTGIQNFFKYRMVNIEDAVAEGYYSEEEASSIRAILKNGYSWGKLDGDHGEENLDRMITMLKAAQEQGLIDSSFDFDTLTRNQAATATNMAIWTYGNRYGDNTGVIMKSDSGDKMIEAVSDYLITLKDDKKETQIINEEKFIDKMSVEIGALTQGRSENEDDNPDNDVYEISLKFSLAATINEVTDNLVAKINDAKGNLIKLARIAGTLAEGEEQAEVITENGKKFYRIGGLNLAENEDNLFTIKLEGTQKLIDGVYVLESEYLPNEEAAERYVSFWENVSKSDMIDNIPYLEDSDAGEYAGMIAESGSREQAVQDEIDRRTTNNTKPISQNFVGLFNGKADIDVSMQLALNFNVNEATITTKHEWNNSTLDGDDNETIEEDASRPAPVDADKPEKPVKKGKKNVDSKGKSSKSHSPQTGDTSEMMWYITCLIASFLIMVSVLIKRQYRRAYVKNN